MELQQCLKHCSQFRVGSLNLLGLVHQLHAIDAASILCVACSWTDVLASFMHHAVIALTCHVKCSSVLTYSVHADKRPPCIGVTIVQQVSKAVSRLVATANPIHAYQHCPTQSCSAPIYGCRPPQGVSPGQTPVASTAGTLTEQFKLHDAEQQDLQQQQIQQQEAATDMPQQQEQPQQQQQAAFDMPQQREQPQQQQQAATYMPQQQEQPQQQQSQDQQQQEGSGQVLPQLTEQQALGTEEQGASGGLAAAGLTVEQAADKTQEHAMAAMMGGGPPQWGGRFDNRSLSINSLLI